MIHLSYTEMNSDWWIRREGHSHTVTLHLAVIVILDCVTSTSPVTVDLAQHRIVLASHELSHPPSTIRLSVYQTLLLQNLDTFSALTICIAPEAQPYIPQKRIMPFI